MIDLHNHILPCVDDGARDINEALTMARQAVSQGTTIMAATPHRFHIGKEQVGEFIEKAVAALQVCLDNHEIPLKIVPGVEASMRPDTAEKIRSGSIIPLGGRGGTHVLIEPPFDRIPGIAFSILDSIMDLGLTPLIAHPERNSDVQKSLEFLDSCASRGMAMQITAGSIVGKFGFRPQECAAKIVAHRDWKIIIASDAHDCADRTPDDMLQAVAIAGKWLGDEAAARRMVEDTPRSLLGATV